VHPRTTQRSRKAEIGVCRAGKTAELIPGEAEHGESEIDIPDETETWKSGLSVQRVAVCCRSARLENCG
jgi:hypothetical protein